MKRLILIFHIIVLLTAAASGVADAVSVTPNPPTVLPGGNVQFTINSTFPVAVPSICTFNVNFGDGSPTVNVTRGVDLGGGNYAQTVNHSYATAGVKTVTVQSTGCGTSPLPVPPDPATTTVTVLCPPLTITTAALPTATLGQPYSRQIQRSGGQGTVTFMLDIGILPPGLNLSSGGLISGTPSSTATSSWPFTVAASDSCPLGAQTAMQALVLQLTCPALTITTASLPEATAGLTYSRQIQTSGVIGGVSFSLSGGSLPGGMSLSPSGIISGTPAAAGSYSFTVRAQDTCPLSSRFVTQAYTLTVLSGTTCPALTITSPSVIPVAGGVDQPYSYQIAASGGQPPVTFSLAGGSLPPGLNLGTAGMISGVPTSTGNYSFLINAADSCPPVGQSSQRSFSLEIQSPSSLLSVAPIPASFSIPRGRSSLSSVIHQFTGSPSYNDRLGSPSGSFIVGGEVVEVNQSPLSVNILNGRGQISEAIAVPVRVIERALQRGVRSFVYERTFNDRSVSLISSVTFFITTDAGADFAIRRIDLHFRDYRPETTVPRNFPNLKAYADISFVGSGLLKGYWEVDGGLLGYVEQHLVFGPQVTLQSPDVPQLPTFSGGTHIVRFVIKSPASTVDVPSISYFVTAQEYQSAFLKLIAPDEKAVPADGPVRFEWQKSGGSVLYLIQFFKKKEDAEPFFSALTRDTRYQVPENIFRERFSAGNIYFWKVSGFDSDNNTMAESGVRKFSLK